MAHGMVDQGMDHGQNEALKLALGGHNLLITGQAGSGKTYTVNKIVCSLRQAQKNVQVTATTGKNT
jgi:putative ribosome biogenesis GTPase RsgA